MASTYSPKLRFELIGAGEQAGLWGSTTNKNVGQLIEQAIAGVTTVELDGLSGNYTLTALDGAPDQSRSAVIKCTYAAVPASGAINLIIPTQTKLYVVRNDCGQNITVKTSAQTGGVLLLDGEATLVFCDGTDAIVGLESAAAGTLPVSSGGTGSATFTAGFIKSPGGTGALTSSATVNASTELSGTAPVARGGTGVSTVPSNGQLLIGNGTGYSVANITAGTGISVVNSAGGITIATAGGSGTVTSVGVSGGSTGLTTSGGPITTSGTITLGGTLAITNGGTGATTDSGARSNLGLGSIATQNANNVNITGGSISGVTLSGLPTLSGNNSFSGTNTFDGSEVRINTSNTSSRTLVVGASSSPISTWNSYFFGQSGNPSTVMHSSSVGGVAIAGLIDGSNTTSWAQWYTGNPGSATARGGIDWNGSVIVYTGTSDYRLKQNVVPLNNAVTKLKALKPVEFKWKEFPNTGTHDGFIAHEFAEVIPDGVVGQKDAVDANGNIKPQGVDPSFAIPVLTKALQEAIARIETLEAEVAVLKGN